VPGDRPRWPRAADAAFPRCSTSALVARIRRAELMEVKTAFFFLNEKCSETDLLLIFRLTWVKYIVAITFSSSTL